MNVAIEQTPLENSSRLAAEIARMLFAKLGPVPLVVDQVRLGALLAISFQTHKEYLEKVRQRSTPVETTREPYRERVLRLGRELAEAVAKDEASDGCDLSAGLFGCAVSAWLHKLGGSPEEPSPVKAIPDPDPNERCGYCSVKRSLHNAGGVGSCGNWRPQEKASGKHDSACAYYYGKPCDCGAENGTGELK